MMKNIFEISTENDFKQACLDVFHYQYQNIEIYRKFVDFLNIKVNSIHKVTQIPFLPIEIFKNHKIFDKNKVTDFYFQSSGTTQTNLSKHWISDLEIYHQSIEKSFKQFIGNPKDFIFLGLLPNYLERHNSSLVYMVNHLMKLSGKEENGYFLYNHKELLETLKILAQNKHKTALFGVSFALLDFIDELNRLNETLPKNENLIIIETGGMKGRKKEIIKDELLNLLQNGLNTKKIYSEYSMTELLSQAYSLENNWYQCPSWMKILIRNTENPFDYLGENRTGAINIIDLANIHTCSFIATQDLGKKQNNLFQVLGRIDHSDIRGCSLLVS